MDRVFSSAFHGLEELVHSRALHRLLLRFCFCGHSDMCVGGLTEKVLHILANMWSAPSARHVDFLSSYCMFYITRGSRSSGHLTRPEYLRVPLGYQPLLFRLLPPR